MKLAKNFSENFYSFNGEYPLMYKEKYQFYITDQLKNKLSEGITRPTFQEFYREVQEIHVYESLEANGEYIKLIARINGNVLNQDKSEEKEEIVEYTLQIVKVDDQYKVHDYAYAKLQ
ncbi:hypothetical protein JCM21714_2090 [Gracilibacillus boraciitolerans JCM 21714]|uniref:Uncharacterized protein n=1 Tax=Gracilibacillus boraciitolerans JCM 21714 TaxID=1298598 RepID=W4VI31_9BACI|nr:hypothetical protein [Gracilibacillus boraciitolerans]GAE93055.1 hypothetical protein JCM21714_2090 [Gracilibacillus boraciitolerans JCM 21714]